MLRTPRRELLDKVRRRLAFETVEPILTSKIVFKENPSRSGTSSMAQSYVEQNCAQYIVFFLGYRNPHYFENKYFCANCIDIELGFELKQEDEHKYISSGEKPLEQFTDDDHRDKSNYCFTCYTPLYELKVNEQCQHSRPTSNKWRQRFNKRRHYGLRGGGI